MRENECNLNIDERPKKSYCNARGGGRKPPSEIQMEMLKEKYSAFPFKDIREVNAIKQEIEKIVKFIREYYEKNNLGGVIIGISGGKDSAVVAALFVKALGKENVIGLTLPCHTNEKAKIDAQRISDYYGFKLINFDLTEVFDCFKNQINKQDKYWWYTKNSDINLKPRLRMATLYYFAALYSSMKKKQYLVAGTSNKSELFVGYFTKGGDNVCDISVLADFTKEEVIMIGEELNVPNDILNKEPSDDLSNMSDEEKMGVTYRSIAKFMEDESRLDEKIANKIRILHNNSRHKFSTPTYKKINL